jgi:autotransporter-associated beta strand protein
VALGAVYNLAASDTIAAITGAGNTTLGANTLTIANAVGTFAGVISGTGNVVLTTGTQTLSGANTYTGTTTINGGTLALSGSGAIASSSSVINNAIFNINATTSGAAIISLAGNGSGNVVLGIKTLTITNANDSYAGAIAGTGSLVLTTGTQSLSGSNTYTGTTTINGGILSLGSAGAIGSVSTIIFNGGTLRFTAQNTTDYSARFSTAANQQYKFDTNGQSVTMATALNSVGASLTKLGAGLLTLTAANTYTGTTTISAGTLVLGMNASIALSNQLVLNGEFDISPTAGASIIGLSGGVSGSVVLGERSLTISNAQNNIFSGVISGLGGVIINGGTQTLAGPDAYQGNTTLASGATLILGHASALGTGVLNSFGGSLGMTADQNVKLNSLTVNGAVILIGDIRSTGAQTYNNLVTLSPTGNVIIVNTVTLTSNNSPITFNGMILSAANSSASLAINAGTGLVTMTNSVGIATTTTNSVLPTTFALSDLTITARNIRILGDVLTRRNQLFTGAVSIGDNGTKGALLEYYLTLLTSQDPLKPLPVLLNPIYARTFISIDPSIIFAGTVDDLVANTHALFSAAITHLAPNDAGFISPQIQFDAEIGKTTPLYALNLLTMQNTNPAAYIGNIGLKGEVNTFSDQTYRTNTLTADPLAPLTSVTFTVDDINAKISFDLFKAAPVGAADGVYAFTNTDGNATLLFNGPTTFNGLRAIPTFPTNPSVRWNTVSQGMSLSALAASRRSSGGGNAAPKAPELAAPAPINAPRIDPRANLIRRGEIDGAPTMAAIINNNNFEVTKVVAISSGVSVSMGSPARVSTSSESATDEVPIEGVKKVQGAKGVDGCQIGSANCEDEKK